MRTGTRSRLNDSWFGLKDPKERKRIQDRLAQRARRKRLAEESALKETKSAETPSLNAVPHSNALVKGSSTGSGIDQFSTRAESFYQSSGELEIPSLLSISNLGDGLVDPELLESDELQGYMPISVDSYYFPATCQSAYTALFENGVMLGLTCSTTVPSRSKMADAHVPLTLRPTALQLITIHATWIDRFPFPRMRDNMIKYSGLIEEDNFLRDLFCLKSFWIRDGGAGWNPLDWRIGKEMFEKWGYLFQ